MKSAYLVSPTNQIQVMSVEEFTDDIWTKCKRYTAIILAPTLYVFVWI